MTVTLEKATELYLSTLATEGKSPRYIFWLSVRLRFFNDYIRGVYGEGFKLQDLTVGDGRDYLRHLLGRDTLYRDHPMHKEKNGKLKTQDIQGLERAVRLFSACAHEKGYLDENVMRRLKLPQLPKTLPEPLNEEEIQKVLLASCESTGEKLRNFFIYYAFPTCKLQTCAGFTWATAG